MEEEQTETPAFLHLQVFGSILWEAAVGASVINLVISHKYKLLLCKLKWGRWHSHQASSDYSTFPLSYFPEELHPMAGKNPEKKPKTFCRVSALAVKEKSEFKQKTLL